MAGPHTTPRVGVEDQIGDIAGGVAGEIPSMLHPREGLLDEGLARPVDLPGHREARAPEVAVDNVGGGPHRRRGIAG